MAQKDKTPEPNPKHQVIVKYEQIKAHVERNKPIYAFAGGIVLTTAIFVVTRRLTTSVLVKKIVFKDSVLLIQTYARHQGAPSWVVRCVETGEIFTSQSDAAMRMGLDPSTISRHLNGTKAHVMGYHFVRLAMAIPKNG